MTKQREGAAIRQDTRANDNPALRRKPMNSLPEGRDGELDSPAALILASLAGAIIMFSFMWLTAAY